MCQDCIWYTIYIPRMHVCLWLGLVLGRCYLLCSGDKTLGFLKVVPARYFCAVYKYAGKVDLDKGYWNPRRKLGVTMHFSEIIKLQFGKNCQALFCILALFRIIVAYNHQKMRGYPQVSFWIPIALAKVCFSRIAINHVKILRY